MDVALLAVGIAFTVAVRLLLLPTEGFRGDLDQFVAWVHALALAPLGDAYRLNLSFPPGMVYVFGLLAAIEPAFRTATDAADPIIRAAMKTPASLADFGIALCVAYLLRDRPRWAAAAGLAVLLHPAVIDVSAWWGQFESIYLLAGAVALVFAARGWDYPAAAALAVAVMTKPQAVPLLVPFAAWFLARQGVRGAFLPGIIGLLVIGVMWLPFVADGGPAAYLRNLDTYQNGIFAVLSLRAWNAWWLVQSALGHGQFLSDATPLLGPITFRTLGLVATVAFEAVVFLAVLRKPTTRMLTLGLAASVLISFSLLTTMHERYVYGALIYLTPLLPERSPRVLWLALGVAFTLNLLAAIPPTDAIGRALPIDGLLGVVGSLTILAVASATVWLLVRETPRQVLQRPASG